jgi:hypothetical protein
MKTPVCKIIKDKNERTEWHLKHGLGRWVEDYKDARKHSVKISKQLRSSILKAIKRHKLNADMVWGADPDDPKNRRNPSLQPLPHFLNRYRIEVPGWSIKPVIAAKSSKQALDKFWHQYKPPFLHAKPKAVLLPRSNPSRALRSLSKRRYGEVHRVYTASDKRRQYRKGRAPYSKIFTALRRIPLASKRRKKLVSKMRKRKGLKFSYFHKTYGN